MPKYKVFSVSYGHKDTYMGRDLTKEVNEFLETKNILDVQHKVVQEKVEAWMVGGIMTNESYIIEYTDEEEGEYYE